MEQFFGIIAMAVVIEGIVTYVKEWFVSGEIKWQQILAAVIGIALAILYNLDLLALVGMVSTLPVVGCVCTGILISRGSNYIFDFIKALKKILYPDQNADKGNGTE